MVQVTTIRADRISLDQYGGPPGAAEDPPAAAVL
jgi:hypothetical protein